MKLISWNVNGIRACHKKGCFNWFFEYSPDIFCLQETKAGTDRIPEEMRAPNGYFSYFDESKIKKGYSGVAVYSKIEPEKIQYGLGIQKFDSEGRCIGLKLRDFWLFNIYFPNGGGGPDRIKFKLEYYEAFLKLIEKLRKKGESIVFCGDVNTAHEEIDLAHPKENKENTGFLPIERAWISKVIALGYVDTFRHFHPEKKNAYTYWDMKTFARERNVGWRLDYFFVSSDLKQKIKSARVLENILGSDHCPIALDLV